MIGVEDALESEMRSYRQRSVGLLLFLYVLVAYVDSPQMLLVMFISPPEKAFQQNPHAKNAQTIMSEWHFTKSETEWIPGFLQSIFFFGYMIGTILFGQLSDKYGRKNVGWKIYTIGLVFWLAHAFSGGWKQMALFRFLSGLCVGGLCVVNRIMFQESLASNLWAMTGVFHSFWSGIALIYVVACSYYFPSWRSLCLVSSLPMPLGYLFYLYIPETPRWLLTHGRIQDAWRSVQVFARRNNNAYPTPKFIDDDHVEGKINLQSKRHSFVDLFRHSILRHRTFMLGYTWFVISFVYYCITLGAGAFSSNFYLAVMISALSQLPAAPMCIYFIQRQWWGRRRSLFSFMLLASASLLAIYLIPNNTENANYRLLFSMTAKIGSQAAFSLIYVYTTELYPTVLRNVGLGSMSTCARIGCMTAPFVASYAVHSGSQSPFLLYAILCATCGMAALSLPDTLGKKMLNTIEDVGKE